jgi:NAD(P)-dependent dehydrogenase (short-subunit alcohol dehydrogenase family)
MTTSSQPCAVLMGSGPHAPLLAALAHQCEAAGLPAHLSRGGGAEALGLIQGLARQSQHPVLMVHAGEAPSPKPAMACSAQNLEDAWRALCFDAAVAGQETIRAMLPRGQGTLIFLGHASATSPDGGAAALSMGSAGLRSFAQSMARAFGPKGLHVVHLLLQGGAGLDAQLVPQDVAQACWQLHLQHHSTWTHEMDLKPRPALHAKSINLPEGLACPAGSPV